MADPARQTGNSVITRLSASPFSFDFYSAVRLIQQEFRAQPRIGCSVSPSQDPVRFAQSPSLAFAPSTLEAVQQKDPARPAVIFSRHFGLFGPNGPLPLCLTEYARERILHHGDRTFSAFANVFHHRLSCFFFRAWAEARKSVDADRPGDERWPFYVGSLVGLGMESLLQRDNVPDKAKLFYSGRLVNQVRNAEGLEAIIQDFFGIRTELQTFVGRWMNLPEESVCRLGASPSNGTLGSTLIVGSRVWNCQMNFRLRMGPMSLASLERMLPVTSSFQRLADWVRSYCGYQHDWDVQMVLEKNEVPSARLGSGSRLGWTTWLKTKPFEKDSEDIVFHGPI